MQIRRSVCLAAAFSVVSAASVFGGLGPSTVFTPLVSSNGSIPNVPVFTPEAYHSPAINNQGHVFFATINSIRRIGADGEQSLAVEGMHAPGLGQPSDVFQDVSPQGGSVRYAFQVSHTGYAAMHTTVHRPGIQSHYPVVYGGTPGSITPLLQFGQTAPGTGSGTFQIFNTPTVETVQGVDRIAITASIMQSGGQGEKGIWSQNASGQLEKVALTGETFPGALSTIADLGRPHMNGSGSLLFGATLASGIKGIWFKGVTTPQPIAQENQLAVGAGTANVRYESFTDMALSETNKLLFRATLQGQGVETHNNQALYHGAPNTLSLVARTGSPLPGVGGSPVSSIPALVGINNDGDFAFRVVLGNLTVPLPETAVVRSRGGALDVVARNGDPAAGFMDGVTYASLSTAVMNDAGQILFAGKVRGDGITSSNSNAVWLMQHDGSTQLLIQQGQPVLLNGVSKIPTDFYIDYEHPFEDVTGVNARGQVAMHLRFSDNSSGIVVAQVPEPVSGGALAIAIAMLQSRRWVRHRA